jgi:RNA polymerase sigma-70 factor (ECF subfamily)
VTNATVSPELSGAEVPQSVQPLEAQSARERELMERIIGGERELFYELVQPYERVVFHSAVAILGNDADAEEVAQEAMLKALTHLPGFRRESKFSTWLIQIAMNEAKAKLRKERRSLYDSIDARKPSEDGEYIPMELADWREIPSEALEQKELREALNAALKALPEKYRTVLMLRDVQQISIAETAQVLGLTQENVKTRTSRARLQMRDLLAGGWGGAWTTKAESKQGTRNRTKATSMPAAHEAAD